MVIQIITYQTQTTSLEEFKKCILEMKQVYLDNGCVGYKVFQDKDKPEQFIEVAYFDTIESAENFEKLDSLEKRQAFAKFCSTGKVVDETVKVVTGEKFA